MMLSDIGIHKKNSLHETFTLALQYVYFCKYLDYIIVNNVPPWLIYVLVSLSAQLLGL